MCHSYSEKLSSQSRTHLQELPLKHSFPVQIFQAAVQLGCLGDRSDSGQAEKTACAEETPSQEQEQEAQMEQICDAQVELAQSCHIV